MPHTRVLVRALRSTRARRPRSTPPLRPTTFARAMPFPTLGLHPAPGQPVILAQPAASFQVTGAAGPELGGALFWRGWRCLFCIVRGPNAGRATERPARLLSSTDNERKAEATPPLCLSVSYAFAGSACVFRGWPCLPQSCSHLLGGRGTWTAPPGPSCPCARCRHL